MEESPIINRVANSPLVTFNLEDYHPKVSIDSVDLKDILFQGLILREKDLREFVKSNDWKTYSGKHVAVFCSADVIVPTWAFMMIGIALQPFAERVTFGNREAMTEMLFLEALTKLDWEKYRDAKVVIKGCSDMHVPDSVYLEAASRLRAVASSIMYGEPCSTVPLYKRSKEA